MGEEKGGDRLRVEAKKIAVKVARFVARGVPPEVFDWEGTPGIVGEAERRYLALLSQYEDGDEGVRAKLESAANEVVKVWREAVKAWRETQ